METFSALLAICARNSPVTGEFPAQRPVTRSFDVFFDLRLNKQLSKQSWGWWFDLPSPHYDFTVMVFNILIWLMMISGTRSQGIIRHGTDPILLEYSQQQKC